MRICKLRDGTDGTALGVIAENGHVDRIENTETMSEALRSAASGRLSVGARVEAPDFLAPIDEQEVWAAGVTYKRSQNARMEESEGAARFYDLVYTAERPELFFKATARRVVPPGGEVAIRSDSTWSVPEPELAIWLDENLELLGVGLGNDMSARDIEAENPLYLPQAKIYSGGCALGPAVLAVGEFESLPEIEITMSIHRGEHMVYEGRTSTASLARPLSDLVDWLGRDNDFPDGAVLLTGTGIVPPDEFTLEHGDRIEIDGTGLGKLSSTVRRGGEQ